MKLWKRIKKNRLITGFSILCAVFSSVSLFSCFFVTSNVFANSSDLVFDVSSLSSSTIANSSSDLNPSFVSYQYFYIESVPSSYKSSSNNFSVLRFSDSPTSLTNFGSFTYGPSTTAYFLNPVYSLHSSDPSSTFVLLFESHFRSNFTLRFTFTNSPPFSSDCSPPSGDISITSNGTYDVSSYASATVDVPAEVIPGDYHDDLVNIKNSIIICGAILLVIYFFYAIYKLILSPLGGKL